MLALRLPKEVESKLEALAIRTGRTKTFYATQAVIQQIDDIEDYYLAEEAYKDWVADGKKTYSLTEVFGSDD